MNNDMINMKSILLADDEPLDVELTLRALKSHNLANKVVVVATAQRRSIIFIAGADSQCGSRETPLSYCSTTRCLK